VFIVLCNMVSKDVIDDLNLIVGLRIVGCRMFEFEA
jgi:hypothetical protein